MTKQEQTWGNCAYAVGAGAASDIILMMLPSCQALSESNFFEVYACENEKVRKSGIFPINYAEMHFMRDEYNPQQVAVLCHFTGYKKKTISEAGRERFKSEFEIGTSVCKICELHEPRGNELHPKSEVERTKRHGLAIKC